MRVLSLWQPWASAIVIGVKRIETRSWSAPSWVIGERIAIHAAQTRRGVHELKSDPMLDEMIADMDEATGQSRPVAEPWETTMPYGAIIATAVLKACVSTDDRERLPFVWISRVPGGRVAPSAQRELRWGDYSPGRWAWVLEDVRLVLPPVRFAGGPGLTKVWTP